MSATSQLRLITTQKRRPASITKGYTAAALFFLSQHASESVRVTFTLGNYEIHGHEHLYNASVYGDIYTTYMWGLRGRYFSTFIGVNKMHSAWSRQHKKGYQRFIHPTAGHKGTSKNLKGVFDACFQIKRSHSFEIVQELTSTENHF